LINYPDISTLSSLERAIVFHKAGLTNKAEFLYRLICILDPSCFDAFNNLGLLYKESGRLLDSILVFKKGIEYSPFAPSLHYNLSLIYFAAARYFDAFNLLTTCLRLDQDNPAYYVQLARVNLVLGDDNAAVDNCKKALNLDPRCEANTVLAHYYCNILDTSNALHYSRTAFLNSNCDDLDCYTNYTTTLLFLGEYAEAEILTDNWLISHPACRIALMFKALFHLRRYEFEPGWKLFEYRNIKRISFFNTLPPFNPLVHKSVLICAEQGIGDEIMFASVIPSLLENDLNVELECDRRLISLYQRSFNSPNIRFHQRGYLNPSILISESIISIGSLPRFYRQNLVDFKSTSSGYLKALPFHQTFNLSPADSRVLNRSFRIGISWRSTLDRRLNKQNSANLIDLARILFKYTDDVVSLQYGPVFDELEFVKHQTGHRVHHDHNKNLKSDIDYLASLICSCDLVVTTPNITPSLAGALGIPFLLLLPYGGERWRWGANSQTSYWYDTATILRQETHNCWDSVIHQLDSYLMNLLN